MFAIMRHIMRNMIMKEPQEDWPPIEKIVVITDDSVPIDASMTEPAEPPIMIVHANAKRCEIYCEPPPIPAIQAEPPVEIPVE